MPSVTRRFVLAALAALGVGGTLWQRNRAGLSKSAENLHATPLAAPTGPLNVYHLGHSLVGRDMPAMLAQLAGPGHDHALQLGWGSSMREHWEPELTINGFAAENDNPQFRPARAALTGGQYDALVLTEMVEIRDAIRFHDSADYLTRWTQLAKQGNPGARIYLYETWHHRDDPAGWLERLDRDWTRHWLRDITHPALRAGAEIYLIPAGQVMAAFVRALDETDGLEGLAGREDLFARREDGSIDTIHINDLGAYLVALTHYAVLYHRDPLGLPHQLRRADGSAAVAPSSEVARRMQQVVWQVVRSHPETGVPA